MKAFFPDGDLHKPGTDQSPCAAFAAGDLVSPFTPHVWKQDLPLKGDKVEELAQFGILGFAQAMSPFS